jgi:hypothetical protein
MPIYQIAQYQVKSSAIDKPFTARQTPSKIDLRTKPEELPSQNGSGSRHAFSATVTRRIPF